MKKIFFSVFVLVLAGLSGNAQSVEGKKIFTGNCQVCHSVGAGDVVGPDLAGVTERREAGWIKSFVTNSQKMVKEGDATAVEVFKKYNSIPMPPHNFSDDELNSLISYLEEEGQDALAAKESTATEVAPEANKQPEVALAETSNDAPFIVKLLLGVLGTSAVILASVAIYLIRFLRS